MKIKENLIDLIQDIGRNSSDGIFIFNIKTKRLEYVNETMLNLFDISHQIFSQEPAFFINHILPEDFEYVSDQYQRLLEGEKAEHIEFMIKCHDDKVKHVSANGYKIKNGKYIFGKISDITALKDHENYIINYGAKKNTMLDMVTHNLSSPLMMSRNMLYNLENAIETNNLAKVKEAITLIKDTTDHSIDIINDLLEEEHMVSEHIYTKLNRFEVTEKINIILERYLKLYEDYRFDLKKNFDTLHLKTDDVKFLQVINNLLSNAIKWSPSGSTIVIDLLEKEKNILIQIKDSGVGIPKHLQSLVFERYTAASREGLRGEKSIGMGLYIVKKLVILMSGNISFESQEGVGTTFTLELPKEG